MGPLDVRPANTPSDCFFFRHVNRKQIVLSLINVNEFWLIKILIVTIETSVNKTKERLPFVLVSVSVICILSCSVYPMIAFFFFSFTLFASLVS